MNWTRPLRPDPWCQSSFGVGGGLVAICARAGAHRQGCASSRTGSQPGNVAGVLRQVLLNCLRMLDSAKEGTCACVEGANLGEDDRQAVTHSRGRTPQIYLSGGLTST